MAITRSTARTIDRVATNDLYYLSLLLLCIGTMDSVYTPTIEDDAAKALVNFTKMFNKSSDDYSARVLGYLHGKYGARLRVEPVERCSSRTMESWNRMAKRANCEILDIQVNAADACADICVEYKPDNSIFNRLKWHTLLLPTLIVVLLLKYSGILQMLTGFQI